ncbi:protein XNDC1N isoform X3 [Antechinus flavipes]|uniref:protein XNDC1N isoform X3 n=1 Tax=Antechinus flavipes TaxID=38775 RepID=UPI002235E429|nr:protein XNDC1N isoform X3 [Antechinus flavipes]
MAPVKISHVVSFSSQDSRYPVENLLDSNEPIRPWLSSPRDHSGQLKVELQLERAVPISYIDVGNCGCAFLQVDVGRSSWPPGRPFLTLLPMATLMSPADSKLGKNRSGVRMFKDGDFLAPAVDESWDRLRVTCSQPFSRQQPFGLMFLRVRSLLESREAPESPQAPDYSQVEPSVQVPEASPWLASPAIRRTFFPDPQPSHGRVTELRNRLQQLQPGALGRSAHMVLSAACRALPSTSKRCHQGEPSTNHTDSPDVPEAEELGPREQNSENESRTKRRKLPNPKRRPPAAAGPRQCRKMKPRRQQAPQPQTGSDPSPESGRCPICAAGSSAEDPSAQISSTLSLLPMVPHLSPGRVTGHGDSAGYLQGSQPKCLGKLTAHDLGCRFMFILMIILTAFLCGLNNIYVPYQETERLGNFNETFQFLFWTMFGMEEHSVVDMPQFLVPEFVGRALYGIFTIVMVIVLLNMLIAMITNSFQKIEDDADVEWKFARSKLYLSFFREGLTLPVPFNILPSPKAFFYLLRRIFRFFCCCCCKTKEPAYPPIPTFANSGVGAGNGEGEGGSYRVRVIKALVQRYIETARREFEESRRKDLGNRLTELTKTVSRLQSEVAGVRKTLTEGGTPRLPDGVSILSRYITRVRNSFQNLGPTIPETSEVRGEKEEMGERGPEELGIQLSEKMGSQEFRDPELGAQDTEEHATQEVEKSKTQAFEGSYKIPADQVEIHRAFREEGDVNVSPEEGLVARHNPPAAGAE